MRQTGSARFVFGYLSSTQGIRGAFESCTVMMVRTAARSLMAIFASLMLRSPAIADKVAFDAIVLGGALSQNGMVSFRRRFSREDEEALRQFLQSKAREDRNYDQHSIGGAEYGDGER